MAILYGPDLWTDDPSPEDLQRAFRDEQQARTAAFNAAMHNGTPNEPERDLSAGDVHEMLTDLTMALRDVCAYILCDDAQNVIMEYHRAAMARHADRLNDAPPF